MSNRIVVVGGGFAGFWAALAARRVGGDGVDVQLISRDPTLVMRPRLYEADPASLGIDLRPPLAAAGVDFVAGAAETVADDAVVLSDGSRLPFERVVIATGSVMRRPPVPGTETAWSVDSQAEAIAFDARLAALARADAPHLAVVGAGFTGIELALELRDRLAGHGGNGEAMRITLVDRAEVVGPELGPGPRDAIVAALNEAKVDLRLGIEVTGLSPTRITLADGTIEADAVALCTGLAAAPFATQVPGDRDPLGRLLVNGDLRAPEMPHVFVAGDAAAADTGDGHLALQSCQHALQLGRFAGENAARDLLGQPTIPYAQPRYVTCLDLGRAGAVRTQGWDREVVATGAEAKAVKQMINRQLIYPPADADGATLLAMSTTDPARQGRPG
ncbi:MAG: FAD-dependent oxidoreductase [Alphaproteobacteria bacterium]